MSALGLLLACEGSYRRSMEGGFPYGVGVAVTPNGRSEPVFAEHEQSFRAAMSSFHMADDDIDCMVDHALPDRPHGPVEPEQSWSAEELNAFAADCEIDFSGLYYMID